MRSSIRIHEFISNISSADSRDADEQSMVLQQRILAELQDAIRKTENHHINRTGRIVVHVRPRRFHLYGQLQVFTEVSDGEYRLNLPEDSWIISDRNLSSHEYFVEIE
ncbi:MAG: hypothetical protein AAGU32_22370 [Bacillota bacterium]